THSPETDVSPLSSRPSPTKNATAASRSSTQMPTWSIRLTVTHSMLVRKRPLKGRIPPGGGAGIRRGNINRRICQRGPAERLLAHAQVSEHRHKGGFLVTEKEGFEPSRQGFPHLTP